MGIFHAIKMVLIGIMVLAVIAIGTSADASAQSRREIRELQETMNATIRQLRAVQQRVIEHIDSQNEASGDGQNSVDSSLVADMEVRLGTIDHELRNLTGQVEDIMHRQSQIEQRLDRMQADFEMRFGDLEQGAVSRSAGNEVSTARDSEVARVSTSLIQVQTPEEAQALVEEWERQQAEAGLESVVGTDDGTEVSVLPSSVALLPQGSAEERYEVAFGYMRRGDYDHAETAFQEFIAAHANHELTGNAQYWLGESFYARQDYANAADAFLTGYQNFGDGQKGPDSVLKLGMSLANMGQASEACTVFEELVARYSDASQSILRSAAREAERNNCN
jgi:tol-pal system protein YbgF